MAKESGDTYQEGVSCYRLGCANEKIKDYDAAIKVRNYTMKNTTFSWLAMIAYNVFGPKLQFITNTIYIFYFRITKAI